MCTLELIYADDYAKARKEFVKKNAAILPAIRPNTLIEPNLFINLFEFGFYGTLYTELRIHRPNAGTTSFFIKQQMPENYVFTTSHLRGRYSQDCFIVV